ncbi:ABC transporter ATP-binding protein [Rhodopseudomonas sp. HC1]|uniref:ABC transporter ATP-binding protein n=1 Tax=Rhodopseudomonas infernalis TaxID=2897386 RepID=UPI001EE89A41|nr:ABC transporter ATP-binding protein [Rhodopseudomonas infernalis]MCG6205251.1 ABC transporter ATP-binding protein [Rhodopseudomonas infernalis]
MTALPVGALSIEPLGAPRGSAYISITDVDKSYGAESPIAALKDINLDIAAGEFISIVGPSGCGKSTLLKCIAGLQPISAGSISIRGRPVNAPPEDMAIVFQRDVLFDWRTVLDNVLMLVEFKGLRRKDYQERALKLLREYGLDGYAHRFPWELSGGMRQRVAICRALIVDPDLLLMDEPFGALDAMTRDDLNADLERLWYDTRKTVVFITHGIDEAVYLGDRVVVMARNPGRIAEIVDIDIPRPRPLSIRQTEDFGKYVQHIRHLFASMGLVKAE